MMDEIDINIHAVALAGGSGTRFWPFSRKVKPKQLLPLGRNGETLLNATLERFRSLVPPERWWLVVGESHARDCIEAIPEVNPDQVLIEPIARNTAPAIALAAATLARRDPDAVMVVLPADHFVVNEDAFVAAVHTAAKVAQNGAIVTLGIEPDRAEIGYGYIERGGPDERGEGAFRVERFREKPTRELAREYLSRGGFYWNAGVFVVKPAVMLAEIERQLPDIYRLVSGLPDDPDAITLGAAYDTMPSISIDYGVMEGAKDISVVPVDCGWSDVGSWAALGAMAHADNAGNVVWGDALSIDSHDNVFFAPKGHLVAAIGVEGLAVVHTADATLVLPVQDAQRVREVVTLLQEKGLEAFL